MNGPFDRLNLPLDRKSSRRELVITVCAHLLNIRTRLLGMKQIMTVYPAHTIDPNQWIKKFVDDLKAERTE